MQDINDKVLSHDCHSLKFKFFKTDLQSVHLAILLQNKPQLYFKKHIFCAWVTPSSKSRFLLVR